MVSDQKQQLAWLYGAAIGLGFERVELHRDTRLVDGAKVLWGWSLVVSRDKTSRAYDYFIIDAVLEHDGRAYAQSILQLVASWARASGLSDITRLLQHFDADSAREDVREGA